jgi:Na+-transporting NADH:ubiquinone oxidoreductase subunit C
MSLSSKTRERLFTVGFMFSITFVCISAVSLLYLSTQDLVRRNQSLYLRRAVMDVTGAEGAYALPPDDVARWYEQHVAEQNVALPAGGSMPVFVISDPKSRAPLGYAVRRIGNGLWGKIEAMVGLDGTMKALTGVSFIGQNETPGLGARITEDWFRRQFKGKTGPFTLVPENTRSTSPLEMDAITGASVTSAGVRDMLNRTINEVPAVIRKAPELQKAGTPAADEPETQQPEGRE